MPAWSHKGMPRASWLTVLRPATSKHSPGTTPWPSSTVAGRLVLITIAELRSLLAGSAYPCVRWPDSARRVDGRPIRGHAVEFRFNV